MPSSSVVSDGDVQIFMSSVNPDKIRDPRRASPPSPRVREVADDDESDAASVRSDRSKRSEGASDGDSADDETRAGGGGGATTTLVDAETDSMAQFREVGGGRSRPTRSSDDQSRVGGGRASASASSKTPFSDFVRSDGPREREEELLEKSSILIDFERLKLQGIQPTREWTMKDDLHDMTFEMKRLTMQVEEANNISMMRNSLQLACTGVEMLTRRFGILDLDGWSTEVCKDMSRYDRSLGRIYRRYWRRGVSSSPESDVAMALVGSMATFHCQRTFTKKMVGAGGGGGGGRQRGGGGGGFGGGALGGGLAGLGSLFGARGGGGMGFGGGGTTRGDEEDEDDDEEEGLPF